MCEAPVCFPVLAKTIFSFDFAQLPTYITLPNLTGRYCPDVFIYTTLL